MKYLLTGLVSIFLLLVTLFNPIEAHAFCRTMPPDSCPSPNLICPRSDGARFCCSPEPGGCSQVPAGSCIPHGGTGSGSQSCCPGLTRIDVGGSYFVCAAGSGPSSPLPTIFSGPQWANCNGGTGFQTAIGCIPVGADNQGTGIAAFFLRWGLGVAGGLALIMIAYSGYLMTTSLGDPRKLQAGKELLTAAISGLILIVLSAYILDLIGVEILGIF